MCIYKYKYETKYDLLLSFNAVQSLKKIIMNYMSKIAFEIIRRSVTLTLLTIYIRSVGKKKITHFF